MMINFRFYVFIIQTRFISFCGDDDDTSYVLVHELTQFRSTTITSTTRPDQAS
jgi:hypothetical protein